MMEKSLATVDTITPKDRRRWDAEITSHKIELKIFQSQLDRYELISSPSTSTSPSPSPSSSVRSLPHSRGRSRSLEEEREQVENFKRVHSDVQKLKEAAEMAKETATMGAEILTELRAQGERMDGWRNTV